MVGMSFPRAKPPKVVLEAVSMTDLRDFKGKNVLDIGFGKGGEGGLLVYLAKKRCLGLELITRKAVFPLGSGMPRRWVFSPA